MYFTFFDILFLCGLFFDEGWLFFDDGRENAAAAPRD